MLGGGYGDPKTAISPFLDLTHGTRSTNMYGNAEIELILKDKDEYVGWKQ
jgi:hypothetical protein